MKIQYMKKQGMGLKLMKISELISHLEKLKNKHGDLEVAHFEKDLDGDIGVDDIRKCQYEPNIPDDYLDMRSDSSNKEVILIY